jgi:DMSO/TMAO reductase YedYZ molybdopterin-dependent catalytic subunit
VESEPFLAGLLWHRCQQQPGSCGMGLRGLWDWIAVVAVLVMAVPLLPAIPATSDAADDVPSWQLVIKGNVSHPFTLTMHKLIALSSFTEQASVTGVSGAPAESGAWMGVRLSTLLEMAGVEPSAKKIALFANDGYRSNLNLTAAGGYTVMVAYKLDGQWLNEHLRLVTPGKWGYKWVQGLDLIRVVDYDFLGTWESKGYSDSANMNEPKMAPVA